MSALNDRILGAVRAIVREVVREVVGFPATYEYTIQSATSDKLSATPVNPDLGLPPVTDVPLYADSISTQTPTSGGLCHIVFADGDTSKPRCVWTQPQPQTVAIAGGQNPVARLGDEVQCFLPPTLPIVGTLSGSPFTGTITVTNPISGTITGGSAEVSSA